MERRRPGQGAGEMGLSKLPTGFVRAMPTLARKVAPLVDPESRNWLAGEQGEKRAADEVTPIIRRLGGELVCDIKVGDENIDMVAVLPTGVFIIEVKHWSGVVTLRNDVMFRGSRTPHRVHGQVERQRRKLLAILEREVPVEGVIVFVPNADFELKGQAGDGTTPVLLLAALRRFLVESEAGPRPQVLSPVEIAGLAVRMRHGKPMRIRLLGEEPVAQAAPVAPTVGDGPTPCARCGAPMVPRTSARGPFLGCSTFPKCRSTTTLI